MQKQVVLRFTLCFCSGVSTSIGSCDLTLLCMLDEEVLGCDGNGEGTVKRSWFTGGPSTLGGKVAVTIVAFAVARRRDYCAMLDRVFSRMHASSAATLEFLVMFTIDSRRRLPGLVLVDAAIIETRSVSFVEVLVATADFKGRDFCSFLGYLLQ